MCSFCVKSRSAKRIALAARKNGRPRDKTRGVRARTGIALVLRKINAKGRAVATGRSAVAARKMLANALCNQMKLSDAP
ncbi:hypothetical protein MNBD_ALPHA05-2473 [hydrothermal vent metagenome]|uniref:Uncharacterized protein n=1 Tax=hydrothermal vent metagenome TaxID=652676 RepID=A0A3B0RJG7_9ZZZZ